MRTLTHPPLTSTISGVAVSDSRANVSAPGDTYSGRAGGCAACGARARAAAAPATRTMRTRGTRAATARRGSGVREGRIYLRSTVAVARTKAYIWRVLRARII